jgi:hypothetical protein
VLCAVLFETPVIFLPRVRVVNVNPPLLATKIPNKNRMIKHMYHRGCGEGLVGIVLYADIIFSIPAHGA